MSVNTIPKRQIERRSLERLAAMRELYSAAKVWYGWQIALTVVFPVILALLALANEKYSAISAFFGLLSFFIDSYFIENKIKSRKERAAKIQELFDCDIFELPIAPFKTSNDIKVEEVLEHYNAHSKIPSNVEKIKGWYSEEVGKVPLYIARIICQRTNCWWDGNLRRRFTHFLRYVGVSSLCIIIVIGLVRGMNLSSVLLIITGLVPFYQYCTKQYNDNFDAICRLDNLYSFTEQLWTKAIKECASENALALESRRLQDEIFNHRANTPLIFDWIYNRFREEDENMMNVSAEILVEEALSSNCL